MSGLQAERTQAKTTPFEAETDRFRAAVRAGLAQSPKRLPHLFLYDAQGCAHFDAIANSEPYYLTRSELEILERIPPALDATVTDAINTASCSLVYFGGALSRKSTCLLSRMRTVQAFVPIDIAGEHLEASAIEVKLQHLDLEIRPLQADFTVLDQVKRPRLPGLPLGFFPGSTIGQYAPADATALLAIMRRFLGSPSLLLLGVDLVKDPAVLLSAYNQPANARFLLRLLERMRDELGADLVLDDFFLNPRFDADRISVDHLIEARRDSTIRLGAETWSIAAGEQLWVTSSHKYTIPTIDALAGAAGWRLREVWPDSRDYFAVCLFAA